MDKETEQWILDQLARGNWWAWCSVSVKVMFRHYEGIDHLGCCSYESEEDFKQEGGYYSDMIDRAIEELNNNIAKDFDVIKELIDG